jgi:hypothetical protein
LSYVHFSAHCGRGLHQVLKFDQTCNIPNIHHRTHYIAMYTYIYPLLIIAGWKYADYCEGNLRWAVNKTRNAKTMLLYTKNTHIPKLLLNLVAVGIETLVWGNKFLYVCVREVCHLWAELCFDTYHQLLIIVEPLWSQPVLQVHKQVAVDRSEIMAGRRVVKQLPVDILKQCSTASNYKQTRIVMEEHYTGCQHSTIFVLNVRKQLF